MLEPLGEDFWIAPNESLTFSIPSSRGEITCDWLEDGVSVWVNEGNPFDAVVTTSTGEGVACGFQRPPGAFDPPETV